MVYDASKLRAQKVNFFLEPPSARSKIKDTSLLFVDIEETWPMLSSSHDWHVPARNRTRASTVRGEHSRKRLYKYES